MHQEICWFEAHMKRCTKSCYERTIVFIDQEICWFEMLMDKTENMQTRGQPSTLSTCALFQPPPSTPSRCFQILAVSPQCDRPECADSTLCLVAMVRRIGPSLEQHPNTRTRYHRMKQMSTGHRRILCSTSKINPIRNKLSVSMFDQI